MDFMDDYMVIAVIRHGLTDENEKGKYIGWSNPTLSRNGTEMLMKSKQRFEQYEYCFSSDLDRCLETVHHLFPKLPVVSSPLLREIHFGEWEGMTYQNLKGDEVFQKWVTDPFHSPPGGEGMSQFRKRVDVAWEQVKDQVEEMNGRRYAVITHGGVIRHLLTTLSPKEELRTFWDWEINHGNGYELVWEKEEDWRQQICTSLRAVPLMGRQDG
ncbi:histidine phosphatase family protein [Rossellomorea aquimaris]|uniref:histidine phosphatase family protein n=1 Tax=Rossellomorea TaxID=2837508 RepID=UPI001CD61F03|nr:histidine phosphatase family protein [Rossellomorea aquimaris]MCA1058608.1 histidine phosphatase family protein [Rossellomorea aquimaris]